MAASTPDDRTSLAEEVPRKVLAFFPLLYIAWADGILMPAEISEIRQRMEAQDWLSEADKKTLATWLDPSDPPSPAQYYRWIRTIRVTARGIPGAEQKSLADLGVEMARLAGEGDGEQGPIPEAHRALADIEAALGIVGHEVARELLRERPAPPAEEAPPRFDVEALQRLLDSPHAEVRDKVRTLLRDPAFAAVDPEISVDAYRDWVFERCKLLAEQGLGALAFPERYGGEGDLEKFLAAFETLAYGDLSLLIKFGVQFGLFGGSIQQLGTERHHEKYLEAAGTMALPGCFAMSELGHGSNVRELETVARYDPEKEAFVIHTPHDSARKEWIGNAARHGRMATVFAQLEIDDQSYGVHAFLVPLRDEAGETLPGIRIADSGHKMGLNGVDNGRIWFDEVEVPCENLLDRFATVSPEGDYESPIPSSSKRFFTMLSTLVGGRISVAAAGLSAAKVGLAIAIRYGNRRRQFGPKDEPEVPILDYLSHQRRLLPLLANAYALDFAVSDLARRFAGQRFETDLRAVEGHAAALKAFSTWNTTHTLQTARECCGGQGYLTENRFGPLKADTDVFTTFEGDNTVLMLQVAKGLLSEFKQEFQDMNFFGVLKHLAGAARTRLTEMNPVATRQTDEAHLRDPDFHRAAFAYREERLLQSAAQRLRGRIEAGMDSYEAFIECQDHLLTLAEAHAKRLTLESFVAGVEACQDEALRGVLLLLENLFALHHLEADRAWFLEQDYIADGKAKAIRAQVNALCKEVRPLAGDLVAAFAIPEACLAPIAT